MPGRKAFPLRLDPKLYAALRRWAEDELRSTNAQIEFLLGEALRRGGRLKADNPGKGDEPNDPDKPGKSGDETQRRR